MKQLVVTARVLGGNRSALVPAPTARGGLPQTPAKKRHTISGAILFEKPDPKVNNMKIGAVTRYTIFRPYFSLRGAANTGPKPRPKV